MGADSRGVFHFSRQSWSEVTISHPPKPPVDLLSGVSGAALPSGFRQKLGLSAAMEPEMAAMKQTMKHTKVTKKIYPNEEGL